MTSWRCLNTAPFLVQNKHLPISTDCSGGVTKPAIFEHPTPTEVAKIDYAVSLPDINSK